VPAFNKVLLAPVPAAHGNGRIESCGDEGPQPYLRDQLERRQTGGRVGGRRERPQRAAESGADNAQPTTGASSHPAPRVPRRIRNHAPETATAPDAEGDGRGG
jgi:hypothetical protein